MPELKNGRHEAFARLVAEGVGKMFAYGQVYGSTNRVTAQNCGSTVSQRPDVARRIAELQAEGAQEAVWALEERLEYLRDVAMMPYGTVTEESPLCQGKRLKTQGVEYRTPDKLAAVALYNRLSGDLDRQEEEQEPNLLGQMIGEIRSNTYDGEEWGEIIEDRAVALGMGPRKVKTAEEREQERLDRERREDESLAPSGPTMFNGKRVGEHWLGGATEQEYALKREELARKRALEKAAREAGVEIEEEEEEEEESPAPPERAPGESLKNARHERFAHYVARGEAQCEAAARVYGLKRDSALKRGSAVASRPDVAARIAELRQTAARSVGWTRSQRLLYLKRLALAPLGEITEESRYCQGVLRNALGVIYRIPDKVRALALYTQLAGKAGAKTERGEDGLDRMLRKHPELAGR